MSYNFDEEINLMLKDQIVTYKKLCNRFNVTPFEAIRALEIYATRNREKKNETIVSIIKYLVCVQDKISGFNRFMVVSNDQLDNLNNEYNISYKNIYSIASFEIEDLNLIYSSDIHATNGQLTSNLKLALPLKTSLHSIEQNLIASNQNLTKEMENTNQLASESYNATSKTLISPKPIPLKNQSITKFLLKNNKYLN
jgi:hypothetical protein